MIVNAKIKKALATIRKELGFSPYDMKNMLGDAVTLSMIKDFENDTSDENDFLVVVYFNLFRFITSERLELEDTYFKPKAEPTTTINRFNPFEKKSSKKRTD